MLRQKLQGMIGSGLAARWFAAVCVAGILVWFPWYAPGYVGLAKFKLAGLLAYILLWALLLTFLMPENARPRHLADRPAFWLAAFTGCTLVSTLCAEESRSALWGAEGYLGGFLLCGLCLLLYLGVRWWSCEDTLTRLAIPFILSGAGVVMLGVLNAFGVDPLGYYAAIPEEETYIFYSTIGNVDYLNSFLCLWLPVAVGLFVWGRAAQRAIGLTCAAAGFVGLAALDPGIATLGLGFAALALLWLFPLSGRVLSRLATLAGLWLLSQWAVQGASTLWPLRMTERPFSVLARPWIALPGAAALGLTALWLHRRQNWPGQRLWQRCAVGCAVAVMVLLFGLCTLGGLSLGCFDNFFCLNAQWATGRGALTADGAALFVQSDLLHKLIGCGPGMLRRAMAATHVPYPLSDAAALHNEYLDLCISGGLLGLALWLGALGSHLRRGFALRGPALGWALGVCAYVGQAFFNNRVVAVYPLFVVMLALLCAGTRPAPEGECARAYTPAAVVGGALLWLPACLLARLLFGVIMG